MYDIGLGSAVSPLIASVSVEYTPEPCTVSCVCVPSVLSSITILVVLVPAPDGIEGDLECAALTDTHDERYDSPGLC